MSVRPSHVTFLKMSEWMDVLHGKMTNGKLTATERTNPNLTNSTRPEGGRAVKMLPELKVLKVVQYDHGTALINVVKLRIHRKGTLHR